MRALLTFAFLSWAGSFLHADPANTDARRIVSAGGALTEIICALGVQNQLVAVDLTSQYPESVKSLPQIGYLRTLSTEGLLSLKPDLIIVSSEAGPPEVLTQIQSTGIPVEVIPEDRSFAGTEAKIRQVARVLGREKAGEALVASLEKSRVALDAMQGDNPHPKTMYLMAREGNTLLSAGQGTSAHAMIELAGGDNVGAAWQGYKALSAEAMAALRPDVIIIGTRTVEAAGGLEAILRTPAIALTPAGKSNRIIVMDDLFLLGFGPRLGQAAFELAKAIHSE